MPWTGTTFLSVVYATLQYFSILSHKRNDKRKLNLLNIMCVLNFPTIFSEIFLILRINDHKFMLVFMWSTRYDCQILMKLEFSQQILEKYSGFGLEVSVLAFGTRVRGFKPGRSRRIFRAKKFLSAPSFVGEVKPSVPCRKFTACKRTKKLRGSRQFRQNSWPFLAHSFTFRCWGSLASFQVWGTPGGCSWNVLISGPPGWGFDAPLATALCKNLPAENIQR